MIPVRVVGRLAGAVHGFLCTGFVPVFGYPPLPDTKRVEWKMEYEKWTAIFPPPRPYIFPILCAAIDRALSHRIFR